MSGKILKMKKAYPDLLDELVICWSCRRYYYEKGEPKNTISPNNCQTHHFASVETDSPYVSNETASTQANLNELLNELKNELNSLQRRDFSSLPQNDPFRVSIVTIVTGSWSIRKLAYEFQTSYRMARKTIKWRNLNGLLIPWVTAAEKSLPTATVLKVKECYDNEYIKISRQCLIPLI